MHMSLSRRTQILLDEDRYAQLEHRATQTGRSVAAVIREAIDEKLSHDDRGALRRDALADLLSAPLPAYAHEPDWPEVKDGLRGRTVR